MLHSTWPKPPLQCSNSISIGVCPPVSHLSTVFRFLIACTNSKISSAMCCVLLCVEGIRRWLRVFFSSQGSASSSTTSGQCTAGSLSRCDRKSFSYS